MSDALRKRILFIGEAATLAHVVRPLVLARSLAADKYDVHFATADNDLMAGKDFIFRDADCTRWTLHSQPSADFLRATASGARLFEFSTLEAYAAADIELFRQVRPDLVIGDMRQSLASSAPSYGVPYMAIQNAYWSRFMTLEEFPLPEFASIRMMAKLLGQRAAKFLFGLSRPSVFKHHLQPYNQLREKYGLPPFDDLLSALTHGDHTLYADLPELVPTRGAPASHHYLGPIQWTPPVPTPPWWEELPTDRPLIYISLGSSGQTDVMPVILDALAKLPVTVMLATAGTVRRAGYPENVHVADYLPGDKAAERSALVIGNGGSGVIYQAIAAGVPMLGIPSNMDQLLAMAHVERQGCGIMLRSGSANAASVSRAVEALLEEGRYRSAAGELRQAMAHRDAPTVFSAFVDGFFSAPAPPA